MATEESKATVTWLRTRQCFIEGFATFIFILLGLCSEISIQLSSAVAVGTRNRLATFIIPIGWGLAYTMGIFVGGSYSGAHLNGAVSMGYAVAGKMPWRFLLIYLVVQTIGSFLGTGIAYLLYADQIDARFGGISNNVDAPAFFSGLPDPRGGMHYDFLVPFIAVLIFVGIIAATTDPRNMGITKSLRPMYVGLTLTTMLWALSANPRRWLIMNPTADLGMRTFSSFMMPQMTNWLGALLSWFGGLLGGSLGALFYFVGIEYRRAFTMPTAPVGASALNRDNIEHWKGPSVANIVTTDHQQDIAEAEDLEEL